MGKRCPEHITGIERSLLTEKLLLLIYKKNQSQATAFLIFCTSRTFNILESNTQGIMFPAAQMKTDKIIKQNCLKSNKYKGAQPSHITMTRKVHSAQYLYTTKYHALIIEQRKRMRLFSATARAAIIIYLTAYSSDFTTEPHE